MKKLFAILLAAAVFAPSAIVASAASTTTLTTTVPAATYTLNIPADQTIRFGALSPEIGELTVSDEVGFAEGKNLKVTITYSDFVCDDVSTTIPMTIHAKYTNDDQTISSGGALVFKGRSTGGLFPPYSGGYLEHLYVSVAGEDWGKALAGEYSATITFNAEVVAE